VAVPKEGKSAPDAKLCNGWVEEEQTTTTFAEQVCARQTVLYSILSSDFWPIKGKWSQVQCDCHFYNLADEKDGCAEILVHKCSAVTPFPLEIAEIALFCYLSDVLVTH